MTEIDVAKTLQETKQKFEQLRREVVTVQSEYEKNLAELEQMGYKIDKTQIAFFMKKFWYTHPTSNPNEWEVIIPIFIPFNIGKWDRTEGGYNIFIINRFTKWFGEKIPDYINKEINMPPELKLTVSNNTLLFPEEKQEQIERKFNKHLRLIEKGKATIIQGHEFDLIAEIIDSGSLPFEPKQVAQEDLMESDFTKIYDELESTEEKPVYHDLQIFEGKYSFQGDAWKTFLQYGSVGIFWGTGFGKTIIGTYIFSRIKGLKLLIVPTVTLREQWIQFFKWNCPRLLSEVEIITYQGMTPKKWEELKKKSYACVGYDECHRLPADGFSKAATLKTKYRFGLSATPYREDERTDLIMALTGYPIGVDWRTTMQVLGKEYHTVNVHIVKDLESKYALVQQLYNIERRTLLFVYRLDIGRHLSEMLDIPFISSETKNRLEIVKQNHSVVASQVLEEGTSIKDLAHVIEVDFQFGGRREELQRSGRLLHSIVKGKIHDIIMTKEEYENHSKRLFSLYEKGFRPRLISHMTGVSITQTLNIKTTTSKQAKAPINKDYSKEIDKMYEDGFFRIARKVNDVSEEVARRSIPLSTKTRKMIWVKVNSMVKSGLLYKTRTKSGYEFQSRSQK